MLTSVRLAPVVLLLCSCGVYPPGPEPEAASEDVDGDGYTFRIDCDDEDPAIHPEAVDACGDGVDQDCTSGDPVCAPLDTDLDGFPAGPDCDDALALVYPGAAEVCGDGVDQDCDGGDLSCPGQDRDSDGDGAPASLDCDDRRPDVFPGAPERCGDGVDQDCDGADASCADDLDRDGHATLASGGDDCDDSRDDVHPGADERPFDGLDQNCDGSDNLYGAGGFDIGSGSADVWPVAAYAGGRYLVAWMQHDTAALVVRLLGADGQPIGAERRVATLTRPPDDLWSALPLQLATDGNGFLLLWNGSYGGTVEVLRLDLDGVPVGGPIEIDPDGDQDSYGTLAALPGKYLVSWWWMGGQSRGQQLCVLDAATGTTSAIRSLAQLDGPVATASDGYDFFVVWSPDMQAHHEVQRYDPTGAPVDREIVVARDTDEFTPVLGFDGSSFLVSFSRRDDVRRKRFTPAGVLFDPAGEPGPLVSDAVGVQYARAVLPLDDGWFVVFADDRWHVQQDGNDVWGYYGQRLSADGAPVGTPTGFNQGLLYESQWLEASFATDGARILTVWARRGAAVRGMLITP